MPILTFERKMKHVPWLMFVVWRRGPSAAAAWCPGYLGSVKHQHTVSRSQQLQLEVDVKFGNLELVVKTIYLFVICLS